MTLRPSLFWLLLTLAAALAALYIAARSMQRAETAIAAAVFAAVLCAAAFRTNAPLWGQQAKSVTQRDAMAANVLLIMLAFLWVALAFYAVYLGTAIRWQHGWEYGTAATLFGCAYAYYLARLSDAKSPAAQPEAITRMAKIAGYQAGLIGIGIVWLIGAGKLVTHKGDWVANDLFLAGGFAIICISIILIKTNSVLSERSGATAG